MLKKMTIAYIVGEFPSYSEYFILNEIKELQKKGFKIVILAIKKGSGVGSDALGAGDDVIYDTRFFSRAKWVAHVYAYRTIKKRYVQLLTGALQSARTGKHFSTAVYFFYRLKDTPVDQIHAHFLSLPAAIASLLSKLLNITFSGSAHANDIFTTPKADLISRIGQATFIVTCTQFNAAYLKKIAGEKKGARIYQIYHGIDLLHWPKRKTAIKEGGGSAIHLLTIARLVEKKGIIYLLAAVDLLTKQGYTITCTIIGDGPLLPYYKKYIHDHRLNKIVHLLGALPQEAVQPFYNKADLFVLPCIQAKNGDRDGLPNVLVEALAVGVPVITTRLSAIPELIEHEMTGLLVREKDAQGIAAAIVRLKKDTTLYSAIIQNGWTKVQAFNIEYSTNQLSDLFERK
jgi:glycosyltransferase involved in cell wall biosynthesis